MKKIAQELYALINYGEMRRKISFLNEKCLMKLRDLVYKGFVTLRMKGKNVKIKTPSCKALRQLNQLEGNSKFQTVSKYVYTIYICMCIGCTKLMVDQT